MPFAKRRLRFAAPFVVTALGCSHPAPKQPVPEASPDAAPTTTTETPEPAPEGKGAWTKLEDRWVFSYEAGGVVKHYKESGLCMYDSQWCMSKPGDPIDTTPKRCNPPPVREVTCPPDRPAD